MGLAEAADASRAVLAYRNSKLIGFFRYSFFQDFKLPNILVGAGTWVSARHRGRGIGKRLWELAIKKQQAANIEVYAATREGLLLVRRMKKQYPKLQWDITASTSAYRGENT